MTDEPPEDASGGAPPADVIKAEEDDLFGDMSDEEEVMADPAGNQDTANPDLADELFGDDDDDVATAVVPVVVANTIKGEKDDDEEDLFGDDGDDDITLQNQGVYDGAHADPFARPVREKVIAQGETMRIYREPKDEKRYPTERIALSRLPNILGVVSDIYNKTSYEKEDETIKVKNRAGVEIERVRLVENIMRWRYKRDAEGNLLDKEGNVLDDNMHANAAKESNARFVQFEDGSEYLALGNEMFLIENTKKFKGTSVLYECLSTLKDNRDEDEEEDNEHLSDLEIAQKEERENEKRISRCVGEVHQNVRFVPGAGTVSRSHTTLRKRVAEQHVKQPKIIKIRGNVNAKEDDDKLKLLEKKDRDYDRKRRERERRDSNRSLSKRNSSKTSAAWLQAGAERGDDDDDDDDEEEAGYGDDAQMEESYKRGSVGRGDTNKLLKSKGDNDDDDDDEDEDDDDDNIGDDSDDDEDVASSKKRRKGNKHQVISSSSDDDDE